MGKSVSDKTKEENNNKSKEENKTEVDPRNKLNELDGKSWIKETKSVWFQQGLGKNHEHAKIEREHPAPFSFQDIMRLIKFFTKTEQKVLDPFSGVASTLKACSLCNRRGTGIELSKHWNSLGKERLKTEVGESALETQVLITGDSRKVLLDFDEEQFHFVVTSPPYWNILNKDADHKVEQERLENGLAKKYSEEERDLGNIESYDKFLEEVEKVFDECYRILHEGKYMAIVVSDFRDGSEYIPFHSDLTNAIKDSPDNNFTLQGIKILVQNNKSLFPYGYPYAYVPNIHHQYILIFRKPK